MLRSISRVELHGASYQQYETLHGIMEGRGFSRLIRGDDGVWYKLPPAEYHFAGEATPEQVRAAACDSAARVVSSYAVLVTDYTRCAWQGLQKA
jgi:hypothetical protein